MFGGKVKVKPLLVTDQPAGRAEVRARLLSPGGELAVLADGVTAVRHLAYVELREGKIRGNHFHKLRHESFYVIAGELEFHLKDLTTGEQRVIPLKAGDLAEIAPEIVHTFVPRTSGHAIEFAPELFDTQDVCRHVIF